MVNRVTICLGRVTKLGVLWAYEERGLVSGIYLCDLW